MWQKAEEYLPNPSPQGPHPTNFETQLNKQTRNQIQFFPQGPHPTKFKSQTRKQSQFLKHKIELQFKLNPNLTFESKYRTLKIVS